MKVKVAQSDGAITINRGGVVSTYEVENGSVTVPDGDPNLPRIQALEAPAPTAPAGSTPTPEPPADPESEAI